MRILIIQYQMLGDVLTSTIIADQLKIANPLALVDYVITAPAVALVKGHPSIETIIPVKKQDMETIGGIISLSRKLTHENYDIIIDAYGKNSSALLCFLTRAKQKLGYKKWFAPLVYTKSVKNKPDFKIDFKGTSLWSRLILTTLLDIKPDWNLQPAIYLSDKERLNARKWLENAALNLNKPITMIGVLGSENSKTLPAEIMAQLLDFTVQTTKTQVLFNYIPSQKEQALAIYDLCNEATKKHIFIDHYPSSIRDFLSVLSHCTTIIGNEGGAINMAKALNIPTFSIFSPWIVKESWNAGEDDTKHIAVHLRDYEPALYADRDYKNMKKNAAALYKKLTAVKMLPKLSLFLREHY